MAVSYTHLDVYKRQTVYDIGGCALILVMVLLVTQREEKPAAEDGGFEQAPDAPLFLGPAAVLGYFSSRVAERDDCLLYTSPCAMRSQRFDRIGCPRSGP